MRFKSCVGAIGLVLSMMRPAIAQVTQPPTSTAAWSDVSHLAAGQDIRLNTMTGESVHGTVVAADAASITVLVKGHNRRVAQEDVRQVSIVRGLDRSRHAVIGLALGAAAGTVAVSLHCRDASASCKEAAPAYVLPSAGIGAAIGALLPKRKIWREIYVHP